MNYLQFGMFIVFFFSVASGGLMILNLINREDRSFINTSVFLGESLLLGSTLLVGELLFLSLIGLYKAPYLWGVVLLNLCFFLNTKIRKDFILIFRKGLSFNLPSLILILLLAVFIFRNCYFLVDVDSHGGYLFTQKFWLSSGSSLVGDASFDARLFVPQFNAVPYSLGLSIFGSETLFPQLINTFWRLIVIILVFGYTSYYFNGYYGLAASMFVLFNDHFFYSGANQYVIINGAVIAFYFAAAYNFWEARRKNCSFRLLLAIIFLTQILANKYQMSFDLLFLAILGITIQPNLRQKIKEIFSRRVRIYCLVAASLIMGLWFLKNLILSGNPLFPMLAGKLRTFNWSPELEMVSLKRAFYIEPMKLFKFLSYFFIWPGVNVAKYVYFSIIFLPLIVLRVFMRQTFDREALLGVCFWLGLSLISLVGICFTGWQDPRAYRYLIAVFSFASVISISYIFTDVLLLRSKFIIGCVILLLSLIGSRNEGVKIIKMSGGGLNFPTVKENFEVIIDRIHMDYAERKHYPSVNAIKVILGENRDKINNLAWDVDPLGPYISAFLLPIKSVVSLQQNALIGWDSYNNEAMICRDLQKYSIDWVITRINDKFVIISKEDYAKIAIKLERYPAYTNYNYGFPEELKKINY